MEKSCGCIIINDKKVLVIRQVNGDYGFPKGHIEDGETEEECAIRETFEEVGLNVRVDSNLRFKVSYFVHGNIPKDAIYFISFIDGNSDIVIQEDEIEEAMWIDIDKVSDILEYKNLRNLWKLAYDSYREVYNG